MWPVGLGAVLDHLQLFLNGPRQSMVTVHHGTSGRVGSRAQQGPQLWLPKGGATLSCGHIAPAGRVVQCDPSSHTAPLSALCHLSSEEWQKVSKSEREKMGVTVQDDGEFWSVPSSCSPLAGNMAGGRLWLGTQASRGKCVG